MTICRMLSSNYNSTEVDKNTLLGVLSSIINIGWQVTRLTQTFTIEPIFFGFQPTHPVRGATADFSTFRGRICEPNTNEFVWRTKEESNRELFLFYSSFTPQHGCERFWGILRAPSSHYSINTPSGSYPDFTPKCSIRVLYLSPR